MAFTQIVRCRDAVPDHGHLSGPAMVSRIATAKKVTDAPDGDLKFHAPVVTTQLLKGHTWIVSFTECVSDVADKVASVYRPPLQTEP
ncbi:hypothetical protein ACRBEV_25470 [Methylobacterium phyllosphaerae]